MLYQGILELVFLQLVGIFAHFESTVSDLPVCQYRAHLAPLNPISTVQLQYLIPEGKGKTRFYILIFVYKSFFQINVFCNILIVSHFSKHNDEATVSCKIIR